MSDRLSEEYGGGFGSGISENVIQGAKLKIERQAGCPAGLHTATVLCITPGEHLHLRGAHPRAAYWGRPSFRGGLQKTSRSNQKPQMRANLRYSRTWAEAAVPFVGQQWTYPRGVLTNMATLGLPGGPGLRLRGSTPKIGLILLRELASHMPCSMAKINRYLKKNTANSSWK